MDLPQGKGPDGAKIMFVGEAWGKDEEQAGEPFVGRAGTLLRKFLMEEGIDPGDCYFTNLINKKPPGNDLYKWFDSDGFPGKMLMRGMFQLEQEIERVKPNVIVPLGNIPLAMLTDKAKLVRSKERNRKEYTGIGNWRGSIIPCTMVEDYKCVPTYHPAYISRAMSDHGTFKADLMRIKEESAFPHIRPVEKTIVLDPQGSDRFWVRDRLLSDADNIVTFDIEYIGDKLLCLGMTASADEAYVIPTKTEGDIQFIREILMSGVGLNAQNSMFDCSIMEWHYGMSVLRFLKHDTMLAAHALNIELPKGQDYLTSIYTRQPYYKDMVDWRMIKAGKQSIEDVLLYNGIDVWTEHAVMEAQLKELADEPQEIRDVFYHEMALLTVLWEISKRGVRIDHNLLEEKIREADENIEVNRALLKNMAGSELNVKSTKQVGEFLFDRLGLPVLKKGKTGPSTDDKTMAELLGRATNEKQVQAVTLIRETRKYRDQKSKFYDVELDHDQRSRGMYNPAGTGTGRLASKKFYPTGKGHQQQNIPRGDARECFIPDEGKEFAYADLERAESLVVSIITQDPLMLAHHAPGVDAHKELAAILYNIEVEEVDKEKRNMGKQTRHAGNYMQGPRTFMLNFNKKVAEMGVDPIDYREAKAMIYKYRDLHPGLRRWWDDTEKELWRTRTLYNLLGRRRIFFDHVSSTVPVAVAFVPQSTVGDILNVGLLSTAGKPSPYLERLDIWHKYKDIGDELKEYGFELLLQVHDAIGYQYDVEHRDQVHRLVRQALQIPLYSPRDYEEFTIPVEVQYGPSWGGVDLWVDPNEKQPAAGTPA